MSTILLTNDLFFGARVGEAARRSNQPLRMLSSQEALLEQVAQPDVSLVILDLTFPGCQPEPLVLQLRERNAAARIWAFGPHVQGGKLQAARTAGCDEVLTRGNFSQRLDDPNFAW